MGRVPSAGRQALGAANQLPLTCYESMIWLENGKRVDEIITLLMFPEVFILMHVVKGQSAPSPLMA